MEKHFKSVRVFSVQKNVPTKIAKPAMIDVLPPSKYLLEQHFFRKSMEKHYKSQCKGFFSVQKTVLTNIVKPAITAMYCLLIKIT